MAAKGYVDFRISDIAAEAQMSSGAFYVYFADREEAGREVLSGLIRRLYLFDQNRDRGESGVQLIARHLEALQGDAPLARALCQAVLVDDVLASLQIRALGLWRARLCAALLGAPEADHILKGSPRPDVLDFMIEGMTRRAGSPLLDQGALARVAADVARAWLAAQPQAVVAPSASARAYKSSPAQAYDPSVRVA